MNWSLLFSTFGLVFIAELGDKTQLAVMTQTCKFGRPWPVFLGASIALSATTALGAVGGSVLGYLIPPIVMRMVAALAFVVMGVLIWRESAKQDKACEVTPEVAGECADPNLVSRRTRWHWAAFLSTFTLLFVAEMGDKTQLAVVGLTSKQAAPWPVFAGGALALVTVTALGVLGGQQLCRIIPERLLLKISAAAFVLMGALMAAGIL